jgi:hypothetical protein
VNSGVGAPGRVSRRSAREKPLQNPLELGLNRAADGLALPPDKAGAVVL